MHDDASRLVKQYIAESSRGQCRACMLMPAGVVKQYKLECPCVLMQGQLPSYVFYGAGGLQ